MAEMEILKKEIFNNFILAEELLAKKHLREASIMMEANSKSLTKLVESGLVLDHESNWRRLQVLDIADDLCKKVAEEAITAKHYELNIPEDAIGYDYETIMRGHLNGDLNEVWVKEPYLYNKCQIRYFSKLVMMFIKTTPIKKIHLETNARRNDDEGLQSKLLKEILEELKTLHVELIINYTNGLHLREMKLSTGWTVTFERGLDIYKYIDENLPALAFSKQDLYFCKCRKTRVTFTHISNTETM